MPQCIAHEDHDFRISQDHMVLKAHGINGFLEGKIMSCGDGLRKRAIFAGAGVFMSHSDTSQEIGMKIAPQAIWVQRQGMTPLSVWRHAINPLFGAQRSAPLIQPVYMIGSYEPADPYRAESVAMYAGIYNAVQRLYPRKPKGTPELPLHWTTVKNRFTPMYVPIKVDYSDLEQAGLVALRLWHPKPTAGVFINYTNAPGSSVRDQFCLISTTGGGTYIGPVNAFMSAVCKVLDAKKVSYKLEALDLDRVDRLLSKYLGGPQPAINQGWAGRDITPVVAASLAAGLSPKTFVKTKSKVDLPAAPPFINAIQTLPRLAVDESVSCRGLVDGPGDIKLSLSMSKPDLAQWLADKPVFKVFYQGTELETPLYLASKYQDVDFQSGVLISSSTYGLKPNEYLFELGLRGANITEKLGVGKEKSIDLSLRRVR